MAASAQRNDLPRVELFKLLGDAGRLKLLALCAEEELSVGELADITRESQPQTSKRAQPLRKLGVLKERREGTRTYLRTESTQDEVLRAAFVEGRRLCMSDGSLARVPAIVAAREASAEKFFERETTTAAPIERGPFLAHLTALAPLLPHRHLAVDVGCGEGLLLDVLAPLYERVIAVDRSRAQLARAAERTAQRGFAHVRLFTGSHDDAALIEQVDDLGGADVVFASRVLHHASRPAQAVEAYTRLLKRGGHLVVLDYLPHDDERMREQADVWLGLEPAELSRFAEAAGLEVTSNTPVPDAYRATGSDGQLPWQAFVARKR
jgi:ArsR family transcriptional regulator